MKRLVILAILGVPGLASAQGTITDPPATFTLNAGAFSNSPSGNFTGVSNPTTQDHLFEQGWWYRVFGDTQEVFFPVPNAQNYTGNTATLTWNDVGLNGFSASLVWTVVNTGGPSGSAQGVMTLTNNNPVGLTIGVFHMVDFDVQPTPGDDSATLLHPNDYIGITTAGSGNTAWYRGFGASAFLVRPFGANDVGAVLGNASVNDFDNSGLPFGPGDFTAGFQWATVTIPPGGQQSYTVVLAVNDDVALAADSRTELVHGSSLNRSLGTADNVFIQDFFRIRSSAHQSWEVEVDGTGGDIVGAGGPNVFRLDSDGTTVLQTASSIGAGTSKSLRWENTGTQGFEGFVRVESAGCGTGCTPEDVYRVRAWDTSYSIPRFNNTASQVTILLIQNTSTDTVSGHVWLRNAAGAGAGSQPFSLAPHAVVVINTAGLAPGASGTVTVSHDGRYGSLWGKGVAIEPATGFAFDTAMVPRSR